jgi:hypothetical protein
VAYLLPGQVLSLESLRCRCRFGHRRLRGDGPTEDKSVFPVEAAIAADMTRFVVGASLYCVPSRDGSRAIAQPE